MSLEQTVDNLEIRYANAVTFVGTSNTMIDTTTGRIQTKGIQHNSNVITDVSGPHGRVAPTLKKYPESHVKFKWDAMEKNHNTTNGVGSYYIPGGGYKVSASSMNSQSETAIGGAYGRYAPWQVFDRTGWENTAIEAYGWVSNGSKYSSSDGSVGSAATTTYDGSSTATGEWLELELPTKIKLQRFSVVSLTHNSTAGVDGRMPKTVTLLGSNDGSVWSLIDNVSMGATSPGEGIWDNADVNATGYYKYIRFVVTSTYADGSPAFTDTGFTELEYYGYEEYTPAGDHSVDTTFMSRFNNPQLTGVQVLVDGATGQGTNQISGGPDPSGNQSTMTSPNKYWTLNGTLTSNLSVEANTFLEGDQPHAVSVWFNSSNLEANVSNTCVFSISDQEKLDSVNLDLQSNTWHNLTYAYQGEGGSRVTYLDGRKVAEDQAEDTFGEYPPFAMTGYAQGGYVVSASSDLSGYDAYNAFNNTTPNPVWITESGKYNSGGAGTPTGTADTTVVDGTSEPGEWIQIEMPHKLRINYIEVAPQPQNTGTLDRAPTDAIVAGSNDGTTWTSLRTWTGVSDWALSGTEGVYKTFVMDTNVQKLFKYVRLIVTKTDGIDQYASIADIRIYGHRENDLVRLPDPTNVLKYPHIAMTGPAQRGYVASASSVYSGGGASAREPYNAFGAHTTGLDGNIRWRSADNSGSLGSFTGGWLKLELPHKIVLSRIKYYAYHSSFSPESYVILASNNDTDWVKLHDATGQTNGTFTISSFSEGTPSTPYKYYAFLTRIITNSGTAVIINDLHFFGTGVDSIPIQIGGGNIDKVANFRVYDKFIDQNQALEIWDAQKDEFGRAKSSMTLQKGRLGIGTDEPQGRLAVADEPNIFEPRWPPKPLVGYNTHIEGHGEFVVHRSGDESGGEYRGDSWWIFDDRQNTWNYTYHGERVAGTNDSYFQGSNGEYTGGKSIGGFAGDWNVLESPNPIKINDIIRMRVRSSGQGVGGFIIAAANKFDGVWTKVTEQSNLVWQTGGVGESKTFHFANDTYYKYYAIIITQALSTNGFPTLSNMEFSGIVQQGQSVLHDGQLTLTKSLTVPRIGPALDADDTPRRDRLVVEYNTSTNPTFEGAVRDTSGRGNDGVFYGNTYYDATTKDLTFDGLGNDTIRGTQNIGTGEKVLTMAMWFKRTAAVNAYDYVCTIGTSTTGQMAGFTINSNKFNFTKYGAQTLSTTTINNGQWYHVVGVYKGGNWDTTNTEIYVNGVKETITGGTTSVLNLTGTQITFGDSTLYDGAADFRGSISNFKLYDTALTAEEVKTLYDMGRCDEGHHMVNFSKTRVGIGLGDGEAPRGALDVRGVINADTIRNNNGTLNLEKPKDTDFICGRWTTTLDSSADTNVVTNLGPCMSTQTALGSGMTGSIGRFTAPHDGYYHAICQVVVVTGGTSNLLIVYDANGTNFATNNPYPGTYSEIIDLRSRENVEQCYNFVHVFHMEKNDFIQFRVHSSGYTDGADRKMNCSVHLLNRI